MTKPILTILAVSAGVLSLSACMQSPNSPTSLAPGQYKSTTTSTNSDGTNYEQEKTTNVKVDRYGNKSATVETETTKDPEGLMNKSTTKTTKTY